jgi:hypothetical protein
MKLTEKHIGKYIELYIERGHNYGKSITPWNEVYKIYEIKKDIVICALIVDGIEHDKEKKSINCFKEHHEYIGDCSYYALEVGDIMTEMEYKLRLIK